MSGAALDRRITYLIPLAGIALLVLVAIAQAQNRSQEIGSGLPKDVEAMLDRLSRKVARQAEAAELLNRTQAFYSVGKESHLKGEQDIAIENFTKAREILLAGREDIFYEPSVHTYFLHLSQEIASLREDELPKEGPLVPMNKYVQKFVKYYQAKGRVSAQLAFARLDRYQAMMRKIFQEVGVPEELIYVGLVESSYNPYAYSAAGASGIWQFIPSTGKRYGLKQVGTLDERHNPEKSTRAAARYLHYLHLLFRDWHLALAGYNAGERRVLQIIEKTGIKDFWQMSDRGLLPQETRNYVPSVLAAIVIAKQQFERKSSKSLMPNGSATMSKDKHD